MNLSENFKMEDFIFSTVALRFGIHNELPSELLPDATRTCEGLERAYKVLGSPIHILSGYRCQELNRKVKGSRCSQHIRAQAADIICPQYGHIAAVAEKLVENISVINFDQLIYEFNSWIHLSFSSTPRRSILTMQSSKVGYLPGLII